MRRVTYFLRAFMLGLSPVRLRLDDGVIPFTVKTNAMTDATAALLSAFDGHELEGVRAALNAGDDACCPIRGKLPVLWLLEEYTRSDRLGACLRLLLDRGASLPD